jgi:hypothetical protein
MTTVETTKKETRRAPFTKIVRVGTVPVGARKAQLYCKVEWRNERLSFSGVVGPKSNGDASGGCGQVDMEFAHRDPFDNDRRYGHLVEPGEIGFAPGWDAEKWLDFLDLWKRWHLNDMRAECEHQRAHGWTYDTHRGRQCPVCGYEIGTAWLAERVPTEVLSILKAEYPDTDRQPAWV